MSNPDETENNLKILRQSYLEGLPDEIKTAEQLWEKLRARSEDRESLDTFYGLIHRLNGSGTTFGFPRISKIASSLEAVLRNIVDGHAPLMSAQVRQIADELQTMKKTHGGNAGARGAACFTHHGHRTGTRGRGYRNFSVGARAGGNG